MATSGSDGSEGGGVEKTEERKKPTGPMQKGKCKWFNVAKGFGFITPTDGSGDVFVHQTVIDMPGFRSLDENEEVEFQFQQSEKGLGREATAVTGPDGAPCQGSKRRPKPKYRRRTNKCYNCGKQGHHAKDCPLPQQPKLCHRCQSDQHLIADCPQPPAEPHGNGAKAAKNGSNDSSDSGEAGGEAAESQEGARGENGHT